MKNPEEAADGKQRIHLRPGSLRGAAPAKLHLLPCDVLASRPALVDRFFTPAVRHDADGLQVSFRGRGLRGEEVAVPPGFAGFVMVTEEKGEGLIGKLNFPRDAEDKADEAQEPLERDFVSKGRCSGGWRLIRPLTDLGLRSFVSAGMIGTHTSKL
ncbi:ribonuclease H2 subunit C isoform X3 [Mus caroli]|uniref:Ribonuclease H2 subunit C isoform X3 n=1 Tax=Mus caroli TaxID=10089 RepID=A0A6P7QI74_MUSCR|nr:ribonuclease H2 subunit C isoform X3 [Mus caroli]